MNLNPPTSITKRTRAKTTAAATESTKKPTLTTKSARARKKPVSSPDTGAAPVEATTSYTSDQLRSLIATAAYYRAAARHFAPGNEMEDWLVAEQQVLASLT